LVHSPERLTEASHQLTEYFAGKRQTFDLPLDLRGTDFQQAVWNSLVKIPYGKVLSYGDIARDVGSEKAVRAVGGACGTNPVPIIVPCHRVIGKNGAMTGFSSLGGVCKKEELLRHEGFM